MIGRRSGFASFLGQAIWAYFQGRFLAVSFRKCNYQTPLSSGFTSSAWIVPFWWGEVSIKNDQNNLKVRLFFCDVDTGGHDMNPAKSAYIFGLSRMPGCNRQMKV